MENLNQTIEIVIVEDEEDILELLEYNLSKNGYSVTGFTSTDMVEKFLDEESPALLIMDRNLPHIEGSQFVKMLRERGYDLPIIFLTAKDQGQDIDDGFLAGADDYITKPFRIQELLFRIKAILKRTGKTKQGKIKHRDLLLDIEARILTINEKSIKLTNMEFNLLHIFMQNSQKALEREFLTNSLTEASQDKTINVAINRLKNKIDPDGTKEYISSIWGVGYKLN